MIKELIPNMLDSPMTKASQVHKSYNCWYIGQYTIINKLVVSGQAMVYLCSKDSKVFVLKVYESSPKNDKVFKLEVQILKKIEHTGILPLIEHCQQSQLHQQDSQQSISCHFISMNYLENGDLLEWILHKGYLPQKEGKYMIQQLIRTFRYLGSKSIFHRDVKPENILIADDYKPCIIDFGLAIEHKNSTKGFVGSTRYAAPEIIKEKYYTFKSEIYSLGVVFFFILTGQYPFQVARITDHGYRLLFEKKTNKFWENFESKAKITLSDSFKELFVSMTHHDPEKRPSLDNILDFDWFREKAASEEEYQDYMCRGQNINLFCIQ